LVAPTFWMSPAPTSTIALKGDLDLAAVKTFERVMRPAIAHGGPVTVDVSQLMFIDSTGIRLLAHTARRLGSTGCVVLHGANARVRKVIDLSGIAESCQNLHLLDHPREEQQGAA
jgi:anti-anti-sigma factor